jgi:hypothetical protein
MSTDGSKQIECALLVGWALLILLAGLDATEDETDFRMLALAMASAISSHTFRRVVDAA